MINIQQDMPEVDVLDAIINKNNETQLRIDIDSVKSDLQALESKMAKPKSKIDKQNMHRVKEYLEKLLAKTSDTTLDLIWSIDKHILKSYPIELTCIPEYNIEMTDYISVEDGHLVRIEFRDILEIIAIEMMYRDIGETMESVESKLEHLGITGIHPAHELIKHFEEDQLLYFYRSLKMDDSPYCTLDRKVAFEYFGKKEFACKYYKDNVGYSIKHALAILTQSVLDKLVRNGITFKLCSVSDSGIYFIITKDDVNIDKMLDESAVVRAFGRRFEVKPKVTVF